MQANAPPTLPWLPRYWLLAAVPAAVPYAFEAAQTYAFEATRAPNVSLTTQLLLMLMFFSLFTFAPRIAWAQATRAPGLPKQLVRLATTGLILSAAHLAVLTLILRIMHSPPGWGLSAFGHSFLEVWLGNAGVWLLVYGACCGVIMYALSVRQRETANGEPRTPPQRINVRKGERDVAVPINEIGWIEAAGNYVELHSIDGSYLLRKPLSAMEKELAAAGFVRSHRRALVNAARARAVRHRNGSGYEVELASNMAAPLSRRKVSEFKTLLTQTPASAPPIPQS